MNNYPNYQDKLTYTQKVALEGEVSFIIATSNHDEDIAYRIYTTLNSVPADLYPFLLGCFRKMCDLPDELFIKIRNEINLNNVPLWLWRNKCIADLKESIKLATRTGADLSANPKTLRKKLLESSFILFTKKVACVYPQAAIDLCRDITETEELEFLHTACMVLAQELSNLKTNKKPTKKILNTVMSTCIDLREFLCFSVEYQENKRNGIPEEQEEPSEESEMSAEEVIKEMDNLIQSFFDAVPKKTVIQQPEQDTLFIVKKYFKGSKSNTVLRTFKTKKEAESFVKEILEQFPDLERTCTFVIEHGVIQ